MSIDPELLRTLECAVLDAPDNRPLRVHLIDLLLDAEQPGAALGHCEALLRADPADLEATAMAERARSKLRLSVPPEEPKDLDGPDPVRSEPVRAGADLDAAALFELVRPEVTLDDVAGMADVKERIRVSFLEPMRNEELRRMYGASLRGGLLLWGPPGCGKTFLAKALAGELGVYFIAVGLPDVLDMWVGSSERNMHELFATAREMAPAVLFIDEIDALGHRRSGFRADSVGRNVVNQLLTELDGVETVNEGVFVLGATNRPWDLDAALRRPGRFDRMLLVLPPDAPAREAILRFHLRDRPVEGVDVNAIAARTELFSGADLAHLCESGAELALTDSVRTGRPRPIGQADLLQALGEVTPSTLPWFQSAKSYAEFGGSDRSFTELLTYVRRHRL